MKLTQLIIPISAALAFLPSPAVATLPYNNGDLILGFRASGGNGATTCYEANLGNATTFVNAASGATVTPSIGNIKADLDAIYGTDWSSRSDMLWSVSGAIQPAANGFTNNTMFATREEVTPGTQSTPWTRPSTFGAPAPANKMVSMVSASFGYAAGTNATLNQTQSANSPVGLIQPTTGQQCYASFQPGGANTTGATAFGYFPGSNGIEGTFVNGTAGSVLDLYKVAPGSGAAEWVGTITIAGSGVVTFTRVGGAPSPGALAFTGASFSAPEVDGQSNPSLFGVTFTRTGGTSGAVSAQLSVTGGSLANNTDYTLTDPTTVNFADGAASATVNIRLNAIAPDKLPGTITLALGSPAGGATLGSQATATVTINPVSANVHFGSATYAVSEVVVGGQVAVDVTRDGNTAKPFTVTFSTANGTAIDGIDYTGQNTQLSFALGENSKTVMIDIAHIPGFQGDRSFGVNLTNPSTGAATTSPSTATVTILEDEAPPNRGQIAFGAAALTFNPVDNHAQPNNLAITLSRTGGSNGAVAVDASVSGGVKLVNGTDYAFINPTTVNFADGSATATLHLQLNSIAAAKLPGTIILQLANPTGGATLGAQTTVTINVARRDLVLPTVSATSPLTGSVVPGTFTLTGKAGDANGIDRVEVSLNQGPVQLAALGASAGGKLTYSLAGIQPENGRNTLVITAVDASGNKSVPLNLAVTYINNRPALAGGYNGLLVPAVTPSNSNSGLITLTVTASGSFTGSARLGGFTVPFKGVIGNDGAAHFKPTLLTSLALAGKPLPPAAPVPLGTLELSVAADAMLGAKVTGTLKSDAVTVAANVSAPRNFFNGLTPATTVDPRYTAANKGRFSVVFPAKAQAGLATTAYPQGDGYANLTLTASGALTFAGKLANGVAFGGGAKLAADYSWPCFASLLAGKGSLAGLAVFDDSQANSDLLGTNLLWFVPAKPTSKYYPAGWPAGVQVDLLGAKYVKTVGASVLPGLGAIDPANGNATLVFSDGKLNPGPLSKNLNIAPNNVVTNAPATDKSFLLTIAKGSGLIGGSFKHTDNTKPAFSGITFQKGANAGAYGFFLSTVPATAGATGESGGVSLTAK